MLLVGINDARPGTVLGAIVTDPKAPDQTLLRPGVELDAAMVASVKRRGVTQLWIEDELTKDLDAAVAPELIASRLEVYTRLRDDIKSFSRQTITVASVQSYRQAVMGLVTQAIASGAYASMIDSLFGAGDLATHSSNVAYLSLLAALHAEAYVVSEQKKLDREQARDMSVLGLAGMLHDIGKSRIPPDAARFHDIHADHDHPRPEHYMDHVRVGHQMLSDSRAPARVAHVVLNHHQRFDGGGWPDLTAISAGRINGPLCGRRIHIYARIVAAANVLENLLRDANGARRPPVAALHAFASNEYDGWFDPIIRRTLLLRVPPFAIGADVRLSDKRRAVVVAPNPDDPCRPVVRPLSDEARSKGTLDAVKAIDLHETPGLTITHYMGEDVAGHLYEVPPPPPWPDSAEEHAAAA
jgi:response regulator RpfG family c-di-GMP phosphodiesterase